ncbi:MAG: arginase family protein [Gaiellaceae bacterium]
MRRSLTVIGVPTSAGAFAPGQEQAPQALREAGLLDSLGNAGVRVRDDGDRAVWRWRPDRLNRRAQNLEAVVEIVRETAGRVGRAVAAGEATLVLGGDCTVGIGTVAGHLGGAERVGLVYFDMHADLNVPDSVPEGALDWMGLAHMLGEPGAAPQLVDVGRRSPLLEADQIVLFGWGREQATPFEREAIAHRDIAVVPADEVAADPARAALRARDLISKRCDRLLVHFDVDVVDFTDVPLSENTGRNQGLSYECAMEALHVLLAAPGLAGMTITELNPSHAEDGSGSIHRLATTLAGSLAGSPALRGG